MRQAIQAGTVDGKTGDGARAFSTGFGPVAGGLIASALLSACASPSAIVDSCQPSEPPHQPAAISLTRGSFATLHGVGSRATGRRVFPGGTESEKPVHMDEGALARSQTLAPPRLKPISGRFDSRWRSRPSQLDPCIVPRLIEEKGATAVEAIRILCNGAGPTGPSCISKDPLASGDVGATLAIDQIVHRAARSAGGRSRASRARIASRLRRRAALLDPTANEAGGSCISTRDSRVASPEFPTDEEPMIARHALALNGGAP